MRLKSIYISEYKNLKDFSLSFKSKSFIEIFVGKNGSGKSNFLEAVIEIFQHIYSFDKDRHEIKFSYTISYNINDKVVSIEWRNDELQINNKTRKTIGKTPVPENLLVYYSGHNPSVKNQLRLYETSFQGKIKRASVDESRRLIGIGPEYKELLLAILLVQGDNCKAREYITKKLSIKKLGIEKPGAEEYTEPVLKIILDRPAYAKGSAHAEFNIQENSEQDRYWKPDGITKDFLDRLHSCINSSPGDLAISNGYFPEDDRYILYFKIADLHRAFEDTSMQELFRLFDNLKTLGMLTEIAVPLALEGVSKASASHFSDGQFQAVYIFAITELFKDKDCVTVLDEPDAFLHPEWQFEFLNQVVDISEEATGSNHILMSSHSASTITTADEKCINLFDFDGSKVVSTITSKSDIIQSLSSGLISFSESEAQLNIHNVLENTTGPILFTEGITDEMILEIAWKKLYPTIERNFEIQNAFSCSFIRTLLKDDSLYGNHPERKFFAIFDFDEAFNDWNQLGVDVETDPFKCLMKKRNDRECYSMLLPVPSSDPMRSQVINPHDNSHYGNKSLLTIEHLFYGTPHAEKYFTMDTARPDKFIKFVGNSQKVKFAKQVVPEIPSESFEIFKPIFDSIDSIVTGSENQIQ